MISFKQFLIEGGNATSMHSTSRATAPDIVQVLEFTSKALGISFKTLKDNLIGSSKSVLEGNKKDAGDIDIAIDQSPDKILSKMNKVADGSYNSGSKIASYAIPVNEKMIQVDLMFVSNKDWAKWVYHSSSISKYSGAVRNIILFTALAHVQEHGKDFVLRANGKAVVRASKSIKMGSGMERLFKMAKYNPETGQYKKSVETVNPKDLEAHLKVLGKKITFSHESEITDDPDSVAHFIFGKGVYANDLMTAEDVIKHVHKMNNAQEVISAAKSELSRLGLKTPTEL